MTAFLVSYTDRWSVRAGGQIAVKVSSPGGDYQADLVRIRSADPNPSGPGMIFEDVPAAFAATYPGRAQAIHNGSYGLVALDGLVLPREWTLTVRVQPWLLDGQTQAVLSLLGGKGLSLHVTAEGTELSVGNARCRVTAPMLQRRWYELRVICDGKLLRLVQTALTQDWGVNGSGQAQLSAIIDPPTVLLLAAAPVAGGYGDHFNGRLEHPMLLKGTTQAGAPLQPGEVIAWWDFSLDIPTQKISDRGPHQRHGELVNMPPRAMRGSSWTGDVLKWTEAPEQYAAVHFHDDDLYDCGWQTDFTFRVPAGLPSGVYGIRLRSGGELDIVPVFVLPPPGTATAKVAILFPTYTYQVYANFERDNFDEAFRARRAAWGVYPHHPAEHKEFGLSTYNFHRDGSGVGFSSLRRPVLTFRAGQMAYVDPKGSGLRHFPADMHLAAWLDAMGIAWDAITDHDLEREGEALLSRYACVLTGTHPEYQSLGTLNAVRDWLSAGGRLAYMGGNGFYWRVAVSDAVPDTLELRRTEGGTRAWAAEPGEYYHAFDAGYGGLWRRQDRTPQSLVGVGFTAQGRFEGSYYRRMPDSYAPDLAWIFAGLGEEDIGGFGFSGGGAAGFELDRADSVLGTPPNARLLARSEGHQAHFGVTLEDLLVPVAYALPGNAPDPLIRADMVYFETAKGGAVFSTGSITFCGSLPWNNFDNPISTLLRNVVTRFMA
ncbi:MAG: N,N-dimethylformamidase large subunit [Alphaproteobacteria bacterium]|nr:N,N-dimethylformamidase large subunit [Alphaproteobacteria bacterium]